MIQVKGQPEWRQFIATLPQKLEENVLRGGLHAGVKVIAGKAKDECIDHEVAEAIEVVSRVEPGLVTSTIQFRGEGAYRAIWIEYGTAAHLISVHFRSRSGDLIERPGDKKSLKFGGKFAGASVMHPGAQPHPFLWPAVDTELSSALVTMADHIQVRLAKFGVDAPDTSFEAVQ